MAGYNVVQLFGISILVKKMMLVNHRYLECYNLLLCIPYYQDSDIVHILRAFSSTVPFVLSSFRPPSPYYLPSVSIMNFVMYYIFFINRIVSVLQYTLVTK